jgi:hypothetical protein
MTTKEALWANRIVGYGVKDASQFQANDRNWRTHPQAQRDALHGALNEVGWVAPVVENKRTGLLVDGHERVWQALQNGDAPVPYVEVDLSPEEEAYVLATLDPIGAMAAADREQLDALLREVQSGEAGVQAMLDQLAQDAGVVPGAVGEGDEEAVPEPEYPYVPDARFPSDNPWDVPTLDPRMQALQVELPWQSWGSKAGGRKRAMPGTYHFYVGDYRFEALWTDPMPVVLSGCHAAVEPNFTISLESPRAYVLWCVYRKRWIARYWQTEGVRVFVDLNVPAEYADLTFLGVPKEWRAYVTRGYTERMEATENEWRAACEHHGDDDILFTVYGGGRAVKEMCAERGWGWLAEERDVVKGVIDG